MRIELPETLGDLTLHQANNLLEFLRSSPFDEPSNEKICELISIVSNQPIELLKRVNLEAIEKAFKHIVSIMKRPVRKPPKEVTLNGVIYCFDDDLRVKKWSFGRYIDCNNNELEIHEKPERWVAICYIEKGKEYGDVPLDDRAEVMKEYFKGSDYIDLVDFFLRKYEDMNAGYILLSVARRLNQSQQMKTGQDG